MSKQILLADDSLTIQKVVELTFMDDEFEVEAVGSGDEALEKLAGELPSIVIADVHMPGASGYEVCRQAKAKSADLPVLLLVGTFEALDESEMAASGADGHLKKPFDSQELLQVVRRMIREGGSKPAAPPEADSVPGFESTHHGDFEALDDAPGRASAGFTLDEGGLESEPELAPVDLDLGTRDEAEAVDGETVLVDHLQASSDRGDDAEAPGFDASAETMTVEPPASPNETRVVEAAVEPAGAPASGPIALSDADIDRVARRVVELMSTDTVREVAWDVIPDLAEIVIKDRIRELEAEVE